jgi:hypothetical protein
VQEWRDAQRDRTKHSGTETLEVLWLQVPPWSRIQKAEKNKENEKVCDGGRASIMPADVITLQPSVRMSSDGIPRHDKLQTVHNKHNQKYRERQEKNKSAIITRHRVTTCLNCGAGNTAVG